MEEQAKKSFLINLTFTVSVALIVYVTVRFLFFYLLPFVIALILAWLVQKPASFVSSKLKIKKGLCAAVLTAFFYITTLFLIGFLVYNLVSSLRDIFSQTNFMSFLEDVIKRIKLIFDSALNGISEKWVERLNEIINDMLSDFTHKLTVFFSNFATSIASKLPSFLFSSIITLVAGCYIAKDFERLSRFVSELIGKRKYRNILKVKQIFVNSILKLARGYLILMAITFLELTVAFYLLRLKHPLVIALIVSFIDLLPVFGIGTALIPWSVAEIISGDSKMGISLILIYLAVTVARNFLEPKVIGSQIGINPLFTLIAMFAGLKFFGFWGLFLMPIALIVVIKFYKEEMEDERKLWT